MLLHISEIQSIRFLSGGQRWTWVLRRSHSQQKEDTEYEVVTSQYLRDTFFPDEQGINHVKIISKKPWDLKDMDLFGYLCTKGVTELLRSGIGGKPTLEVRGTIRELCKVVSPEAKSYGQKSYTLVRARLENMIDTKLEAITADGRQIIQQLFDRVIIDNPAHQKRKPRNAKNRAVITRSESDGV